MTSSIKSAVEQCNHNMYSEFGLRGQPAALQICRSYRRIPSRILSELFPSVARFYIAENSLESRITSGLIQCLRPLQNRQQHFQAQ